jgi:hypothetical protein
VCDILTLFQYSELSLTSYPTLSKTVFTIFMILVPILLLNMLIAMMGNTYAHVIEQSEKEWMKQVCMFSCNFNYLLFCSQLINIQESHYCCHILQDGFQTSKYVRKNVNMNMYPEDLP